MSALALKGGTPVRTEGYLPWPQYDNSELAGLQRVLESRVWGTRGPEAKVFEERFTAYQHANYGISFTNGTVTMELALRAKGIGYGDEVIVPPYTFNATVSAVVMVGATPVFADIEQDTFNLDGDKVEQAITSKTKAVIPVHVGGLPVNMDKIMEVARKHNLFVIEDCAHAPGSEWDGRGVGSFGDVGSFSFQLSKVLSAGEGGFLTVQDEDFYDHCYSLHHCGRLKKGDWYDHFNVGTNARMTDWQAAILNAQLDRLDAQIAGRQECVAYLEQGLAQVAFIERLKDDPRVTRNTQYIYGIKYKQDRCKGLSRDRFIEAMQAEGVPVSPGYKCLYSQPALMTEEMKKRTGSRIQYNEIFLENVEKAAHTEGMWIKHPLLMAGHKGIDDIIAAMDKVYQNAEQLL